MGLWQRLAKRWTLPEGSEAQLLEGAPPTARDSVKKWREFGASSAKGRTLVLMRRLSQVFFFLLFLYLLVRTEFRASFEDTPVGEMSTAVHLNQPVSIFLQTDPLVAVSTTLAGHSLYIGLAWALVILVPTLLLGRFFCGWICPFGSLHQWISAVSPSVKGGKRIRRNQFAKYMRAKYYILVAMLVAAAFGSVQIGLLDPICIMVRSVGLAILPATNAVASWLLDGLALTNLGFLQGFADWGHQVRVDWITGKDPVVHGAWFVGFLFLGLLLVNRYITRFWCRGLCPLGAMLGVFAKFSIFGMRKDHEKCTGCNLCLMHCQAADMPQGGEQWRQTECHVCFNCESVCPEDVIHFEFFPKRSDAVADTDMTRRAMLTSAVAGAAMFPLSRITAEFQENFDHRMIRPPGSVIEDDFLERCIKCGECMKVCPNNALHPASLQGGLEGIWSPVLIPRVGYCEATCTLCGEVCPTGAILPVTVNQRLGHEGETLIRMGTAFYDRGRCLPWAMDTPCIVCEEWCPVSPKAIWVEDVIVTRRREDGGEEIHLQRPHIDVDLCIGCGACEWSCPVADDPAVYVTAINESRNPENVLMLRNADQTSGSY
jgi:polyferredoxin